MTDEEQGFPFSEFDWSQMEQLANGVKEEDLTASKGETVILNEQMIAQRIAWDVAPHDMFEEVAAFLELPVPSDDVLEKDHEDAHDRLANILALAAPIDAMSRMSARTVLATMLVMNDQQDEMPLNTEDFEDTAEKLEVVIFNATLAAVAELVDWGHLHTPHVYGAFVGTEEQTSKFAEAVRKAMEQAAKDIEEEGDTDE